jgi:hypothetical protein
VCLCFLLLASKCDYLRDSGLMTWGRCMWSHYWLGLSIPRNPVPGAEAGIRPWPGETLIHPVLLLCSFSLLNQQWELFLPSAGSAILELHLARKCLWRWGLWVQLITEDFSHHYT